MRLPATCLLSPNALPQFSFWENRNQWELYRVVMHFHNILSPSVHTDSHTLHILMHNVLYTHRGLLWLMALCCSSRCLFSSLQAHSGVSCFPSSYYWLWDWTWPRTRYGTNVTREFLFSVFQWTCLFEPPRCLTHTVHSELQWCWAVIIYFCQTDAQDRRKWHALYLLSLLSCFDSCLLWERNFDFSKSLCVCETRSRFSLNASSWRAVDVNTCSVSCCNQTEKETTDNHWNIIIYNGTFCNTVQLTLPHPPTCSFTSFSPPALRPAHMQLHCNCFSPADFILYIQYLIYVPAGFCCAGTLFLLQTWRL